MAAIDVNKVASLARLKLDGDEAETLGRQLASVLDYISLLNEVDTDDVDPMAHAVEQSNVFRCDEIRDSLARDQALANAPASDGEFFLVPQILDADG